MKRVFALVLLFALPWLVAPSFAAAPDRQANGKVGIVLMHGKLGNPLGISIGSGPPIAGKLVAALKDAGYRVVQPEMCWSRVRQYDKPYGDCLNEIDTAVAGLKAQGATAIVVGGQSLGGNAAIAYGATRPGLLGIIGLAPADNPAGKARRPEIAASLAQARDLMAQGKGDQQNSFEDVNTGTAGTFPTKANTTARIYLSFNDPQGLVNFPETLPKLLAPMLWVAGNTDPTQGQSGSFFERLPANPLNRYAPVQANHLATPDAGVEAVLAWLAELPRP